MVGRTAFFLAWLVAMVVDGDCDGFSVGVQQDSIAGESEDKLGVRCLVGTEDEICDGGALDGDWAGGESGEAVRVVRVVVVSQP